MSNNKNKSTQIGGTNADETVVGTPEGEKVDARPGTDTALGGAGDDWVKGGQGDDIVDGGAGSDRVDGNAGNDRLVYTVGENAGARDVYDGGSGTNTLVLKMTRAEWMRDGIQADIAALLAFLASTAANANGVNSSAGFSFSSFGLQVKRIAGLEVFVDGVALDPRDEAVIAIDDAQTAATEHSVVRANVAANDSVPDLVRSVEVVNGPALGSLNMANDGSYSYDPGMAFDTLAVGQTATVAFTYLVTDADRDNATATSSITITGTNDDPVASADGATTDENQAVTVDVLANDTDVDNGDTRHLQTVTVSQGFGTAAVTANALEWNPGKAYDYLAVNESAVVRIDYRMSDNHAAEAGATLTLTVTGSNDAPVAIADTATTTENTVLTVDVLANDIDVDTSDTHLIDSVIIKSAAVPAGGLDLKDPVAGVFAAGQGSVAIVANRIQWNPGNDFDYLALGDTAAVALAYTQNDQNGGTTGATLDIAVTGVNDAPTVQFALGHTANEQDAPFTIDLLQGAGDVDRGALLNAVALSEPTGKGGWVLDGNQLTLTPHHFDRLNEGDTANLTFNYTVRDEHGGEVAQSLTLAIEGFTDAPSLDAIASAGTTVNEIKLAISSQPAYDEQVLLRFSNLPSGARVLNAQRADVTAGVDGFRGIHDFFLVLPAATDADFDLGITVSGLLPNGEVTGATTGALDVVYDHSAVQDAVSFSARNQGMWDSGPAPMVEWHEYIPLVGTVSQTWDKHAETWVDTGPGAWHSGKFTLFSAQVDAQEAKDIALGVAQDTLDAAKAVFAWASVTVDAAAQELYDFAVTTYNKAKQAAKEVFDGAVYYAGIVFNNTLEAAEQVAEDVAWAAYNAAVVVAAGVRDTAITLFGWMGQWVTDQANWDYWNTTTLAAKVRDAAINAVDWSLDSLREAATAVKTATITAAQWVRDSAEAAAQNIFEKAKTDYATAKELAFDAADLVLDAAQDVFDDVAAELDQVQGTTRLDVNAELYADVGVQVDFVLDSGSVDADVDYTLTSVLQHNKTTDTLLITPQLTNQTNGASVAFDTISPNASLKAVLLYEVGVDLEVLLDSYLTVAGTTIWDISPNASGVSDTTTVTTGGWGPDFDALRSDIESLAGDLNLDGIAVGEFELINLDSRNVQDVEVPFIGTLTEDIASVFVGIPTIEAEGTADTWTPGYFNEGGLINLNFAEITDSILNLVTARIDYSPELRAALGLGSLYDSPSFAAAIESIGTAFLGTLFEALDGQSESMPIFLIDANDATDSELLHLNLFPDSVIGSTVNANTAKFGFWTAYGESNDLVRVVIDIDQAVAVIVNKIIEVAAAAGTQGATVQFLAKLPDINPLDLEFGLSDLLKVAEVPQATIDELTKFFDLSVGFEAADVDVYAALRFAQDFALTVDDMLYRVTMEDGHEYQFAANSQGSLQIDNASQHDANGDGSVDYAMELVPKAMFSNDTEIGLTIGYVLDFLQASFSADLKLPVDDLLNIDIPGLPPITINLADIALGPLLRVQGDLDIASADIFEKRFDFDLGSTDVSGGAGLSEQVLVTVIGVDNTTVV